MEEIEKIEEKKDKYAAQKRYHKAHRRDILISFIVPSEQDVYDYLKAKNNMSGYVKNLIREDIKLKREIGV